MSRYRRWINICQAGETIFATTSTLGRAHNFRSDASKDFLAASVLDDCDYYGAIMHAFAFLSNHFHVLMTLPPDHSAGEFFKLAKGNSTSRLRAANVAENRWQIGFRSVGVTNLPMFDQKVKYINCNATKYGLCARAEDYRWCSARAYLTETALDSISLDLPTLIRFYMPDGCPWPRKKRRLDGLVRDW